MHLYSIFVVFFFLIFSNKVLAFTNNDQLLAEKNLTLTVENDVQANLKKKELIKYALKDNIAENPLEDNLRLDAIANIAFDWGLNEGLYFYHSQNQAQLESYSLLLNTIADFSPFVMNGKLLLPAVSKTTRSYEQISDNEARTFSVSYTLEKPAKIVKNPPSWRDYLLRPLSPPTKPNTILFPRNAQESQIFEYEFNQGWIQGDAQAQAILTQDYAHLERDLEQHWNFRELALQNVVRLPTLNKTSYASIQSKDGRTINVNDVIYRVESQSQWESLENWQPVFKEQ